jgi:hypothetical protein
VGLREWLRSEGCTVWRHRRKLVESQAAERNRLLKVLKTANIKLANVATDVFGMSGRMMLRALIEGKATPQEMAELAKGLLRKKVPELQLALKASWKNTIVSCWSFSCNDSKRRRKTWQLWNNASGRSLNLMRRSRPYWIPATRVFSWIWRVSLNLAPIRDDVHYRVSEQPMVREVPDYARQYLIEHPEFGPSIEPWSAGAPSPAKPDQARVAQAPARRQKP